MTPLEIAANAFNLASVFLARRNSVHTWWTGLVAVSLYGVLFFGARLYADVVLQAFFFGSSLVGWWQWLRGGAGATPLPVSTLTARGRLVVAAAVAVASGVAGWAFSTYTDAALPFADSFVLGGSVVAQGLLVRRKLDSWAVWIAVDVVAIGVYAAKALYVTAAVYAVLLVLCGLAAVEWRRLLAAQSGPVAPSGSPVAL